MLVTRLVMKFNFVLLSLTLIFFFYSFFSLLFSFILEIFLFSISSSFRSFFSNIFLILTYFNFPFSIFSSAVFKFLFTQLFSYSCLYFTIISLLFATFSFVSQFRFFNVYFGNNFILISFLFSFKLLFFFSFLYFNYFLCNIKE